MRLIAIALATLLLAGCASPWNAVGLAPGTPREEVLARTGPPTRAFRLPDGLERLQYSMQPFGRASFNADFDGQGRLVRSYQSLTEANLNRIQADVWTVADVEREFGPPGMVDRVYSWPGPVWTYYWRDFAAGSNMFYWVYLDAQGVVRRAHPGMEFVNTPNERK
jgi:hypothetical protein